MPTPAQIEEQLKLERSQVDGGSSRLFKDTDALERKEYASATIYGRCSIDQVLPSIVEGIGLKIGDNLNTATGYQRTLYAYIQSLDAESSAAIAIKRTFDKVFSPKRGDNHVRSVTIAIGSAIEAECQMRHYEKVCPGLLYKLKEKYWHESKGTAQKLTSIQTAINKCATEHKWHRWGRDTQSKVGGWYLDVIEKVTGWFNQALIQQGRKRNQVVVYTEEFVKNKDKIMSQADLFSPLTLPMLVEPQQWSRVDLGGYYLNRLRQCHDMVRRGPPLCIQGDEPFKFLNKIQEVAYRLNPFVVGVAEHFDKRGQAIGKFRPIIHYEVTPKPVDIDSNFEARKEYNKKETQRQNQQSQEFRRSCRTRIIMNVMSKFKDKDRYYIPWSFDYRGRTYPIPSFLTPQDSDFGKSLIRFAEEAEVNKDTEHWLAFHVATTYGLDKATIDERLEWVHEPENIQLIKQVATNPIDNVGSWEKAEEPWQFLAACEEYYSCIISQSRNTTGLPVAIDATCSGLQILAALAEDPKTAQLVNVLPSDKPQDAYKVVAECAKPYIPHSIHSVWDRKAVKRTVMTIPYNAKPFSNRSYIRDALKEKGIEISKEDLTQTVQAVRDAMNQVVPGPMRVMKWIESEVVRAIKDGAKELVWKTPSGFIVTQRLMKKKYKSIELQLLGRCQIRVAIGDDKKVDALHHRNATAPNLIHSLDASLLHKATLKFDNPIALIHDSVLCRATDMTLLSKLVRESYVDIFTNNNVLKDFALAIGAGTDNLPIIGDLEHSKVIDSHYFFC